MRLCATAEGWWRHGEQRAYLRRNLSETKINCPVPIGLSKTKYLLHVKDKKSIRISWLKGIFEGRFFFLTSLPMESTLKAHTGFVVARPCDLFLPLNISPVIRG